MRLICPNCDAQYEVPDDVMPAAGRDVQCSNCGQTWFQHHPDYQPDDDTPGELGDTAPTPDEETAAPPPAPPAKPAPTRKQLDQSVADILRQEAEAEKLARQSKQAEVLESQPDLGLGDASDEPDPDERARLAKNAPRDCVAMSRLVNQQPYQALRSLRRGAIYCPTSRKSIPLCAPETSVDRRILIWKTPP
jgi:predicted Zn finger-like uncharacterized protein